MQRTARHYHAPINPTLGGSYDCSGGCSKRATSSESEECGKNCIDGVGTPFLPRPQGLNSAALFNPFYYGCGVNDRCFSFTLGYRYNQTFREERLARCIFGSETLTFRGSQAPDQNKRAFLADNFGLPPNFRGSLHVSPRIKNHIVDMMTRMELGSWYECFAGAYVAFNASLVHSIWQLGACETRQTPTSSANFAQFPSCYMANTTNNSIEAAGDLHTALSGDFLFGDMQSAWRFGRFDLNDSHKRRDTKLANIDIIVGYDALVCDNYHFGGFLKAVAPTGTKPHGREIFQNIIGNGHHWELGGGIDAHYDLWNCGDHCLAAYVNGCITHLFKDSQWRTFDFKRSKLAGSSHSESSDTAGAGSSGFFSRYVLLKEFDARGNYLNKLINGVNFTTRRIKSSFDLQGDASLRLIYRTCGLAIGVGYNVYGRSKEDISGPCDSCPELFNRHFGIKGINGVCARGNGESKSLSSTSSKARIFDDKKVLRKVDNPVILENPLFVNWNSPKNPAIDSEIDESPAPRLVTKKDLDLKPIPGQLTHKVFAHIDYQWAECDEWQPYMGVGGEVEFANNERCRVCTANQWGAWIRAGANF